MIGVPRPEEPPSFDERVRERGNAWLREHEGERRPLDYWSEFRDELMKAFGHRCGYTALWDVNGTVDHLHCYKHAPNLTYEWSNYRYATGWVNSSKQDKAPGTFMDPCDVEDGWFEVILPSLELVVVRERVPPQLLALAQDTLQNLPIGRHPRVLRARRVYYEMYLNEKITLDQLRIFAPQIATAIVKASRV